MPDADSKPDLIFHWFVNERRGWKLTLAVVAVGLFTAGFLMLFEVVYPATKHQRLVPQRVLMLDLASPVARQVVNSISDHDFLVLREPSGPLTPPGARVPVFEPTFKNFDYRMRDFVETSTASAPLPRVFQPARAPLPLLAGVASVARNEESKEQSLQVVVFEGLEERGLVKSISISEGDAEGLKMRVSVANDGRITSVVPLASSQAQMTLFAKLRPTLDRLRFAPKAAADVEWGTLTFRWTKEAKS